MHDVKYVLNCLIILLMMVTMMLNMSATVHQIVELCAWRGERVYRPHDHNNFNEEEIDALIEYLCTN